MCIKANRQNENTLRVKPVIQRWEEFKKCKVSIRLTGGRGLSRYETRKKRNFLEKYEEPERIDKVFFSANTI